MKKLLLLLLIVGCEENSTEPEVVEDCTGIISPQEKILIEYNCSECGSISRVISDCVNGIVGQGVAAVNVNGIWMGTLVQVCHSFYWIIHNCNPGCYFNCPEI